MFRKISHILLAIVVMITTMGLTVSAHYCGDELKSIDFISQSDNCCGDSCPNCKNKIIKVDTDDDYTISTFNIDFTNDFILLPALIQLFQGSIYTDLVELVAYHKPPPLKIQSVLSDLQVYRL
ncbi:hypothetical protein [Ancylomarina sp. 16SWW S1-10-2]|uniref:HYC_CC_PP family protein n=1 Tax=Ancylomarina sp. 16SWW S1-10-2 TaxID=2499681 RepID=UPI0012ADCFE8|nr:hypothetical protein [Ancylomarina sp. 16SWW S1-10-2]MRT93963.1 hypothetical protein [Ancylomarina sp. 16SWW S1-10-2]